MILAYGWTFGHGQHGVRGWPVLSVPISILSFLEHNFLSSWTNLFQALGSFAHSVFGIPVWDEFDMVPGLEAGGCVRWHSEESLSHRNYQCVSESCHHQPGQSLAHFSILESFLSRREKGNGNKLSVGRENCVSAVLSLLEKIYCVEKIAGVH